MDFYGLGSVQCSDHTSYLVKVCYFLKCHKVSFENCGGYMLKITRKNLKTLLVRKENYDKVVPEKAIVENGQKELKGKGRKLHIEKDVETVGGQNNATGDCRALPLPHFLIPMCI